MSVLPMYGDAGKPMVGDAGKPLACEAAADCCDCCVTGSPTADFSFEQVDDDPCTFDFTDESIVGNCGDIVSWLWKCGSTTISTSQNPTSVNLESVCGGAGPWDITLTVTDATGCTDAVVMEVTCCDCLTGGPTADFSYVQTGECTFSFTDESVAGTCGAIVSWAWYLDAAGTPFSTSQNPTGQTFGSAGDGPWDVRLVVTDAAGCTDEVTATVYCPGLCESCGYGLPPTLTVTLPTFPLTSCPCHPSGSTITVYRQALSGAPICSAVTNACVFCQGEATTCDPGWRVLVTVNDTQIDVSFIGPTNVTNSIFWRLTAASGLCDAGTYNVPFFDVTGSASVCGVSDVSPCGDVVVVIP